MTVISIAGLKVGLDHKYDYTAGVVRDYLGEGDADFSVSATDEQIELERRMSSEEYPVGYLENIVLYRNIAEILPEYSAVVFHGAVIAVDGVAYAITAHSGVGKTTHIRLWLKTLGERAHVLNGDKPVFRIIDGKVYACGTPWRGKEGYGRSEMLPLGGIAFLERSEKNFAVPVSSGQVLSRFITQAYVPRRPDNARRALGVLSGILASVPLIRLGANMQDEAAEIAYRAMSEQYEKNN
jgi:hypothetical protein